MILFANRILECSNSLFVQKVEFCWYDLQKVLIHHCSYNQISKYSVLVVILYLPLADPHFVFSSGWINSFDFVLFCFSEWYSCWPNCKCLMKCIKFWFWSLCRNWLMSWICDPPWLKALPAEKWKLPRILLTDIVPCIRQPSFAWACAFSFQPSRIHCNKMHYYIQFSPFFYLFCLPVQNYLGLCSSLHQHRRVVLLHMSYSIPLVVWHRNKVHNSCRALQDYVVLLFWLHCCLNLTHTDIRLSV